MDREEVEKGREGQGERGGGREGEKEGEGEREGERDGERGKERRYTCMYRWRLKVRYDADDGGRTPEGQRRDSGKDSRRDSKRDSGGRSITCPLQTSVGRASPRVSAGSSR